MNYWDRKNKNYQANKTKLTFANTVVPLHATNCIILSFLCQ